MRRALALCLMIVCATAIAMGAAPQEPGTLLYDRPERVTILGYDGDAMEPFVTRDGRHLLFNNRNDPAEKTDLHWAERIDDLSFAYRGMLRGANTSDALEGVASLDRRGMLYFVSTRSYEKSLSTLYRGRFDAGRVSGVELVAGVSRLEPGMVNFDVDISPDGGTLYFVDGRFAGGGLPKSADIVIADRDGNAFRRRADSGDILRQVNSDALEYAPCISADGLTLFFTRWRKGIGTMPALYVARRAEAMEAFGPVEKLVAAEGMVEAAALSPDEKSLYFHRRDGDRFVLYRLNRR